MCIARRAILFIKLIVRIPQGKEKKNSKEDILPKPMKIGDGKLKGLTIPMVGSQLSGKKEFPVKARRLVRWGKNEETE